MTNSCIGFIDGVPSGATTPRQNGPESNNNERVRHIPQSSKTGASPSDCLASYPRHTLMEVLPLFNDAVGILFSSIRMGPNPRIGRWYVIQLRVREDLRAIRIKQISLFSNALEQEPHHMMQFNVICWTPSLFCGGGSYVSPRNTVIVC